MFLIVYGILIAWYLRAWTSIPPAPRPAAWRTWRTWITVVVAARNEEGNILRCLGALSAQNYPKHLYEVIVVDDHSTDGTVLAVEEFARIAALDSGSTVRCIRLSEEESSGMRSSHKKWAIASGIKAARGQLIVTTDADCVAQPGWLASMAACYEDKGAKFIAAPVRIADSPEHSVGGSHVSRQASSHQPDQSHGLLAIFQTLDFITLQGITGASVYRRFHSMCNGANLAYDKSAFEEVGGFEGIDSIPSGDDMLLMHKIYCRYPEKVFFLKDREAIVTTRPERRWSGFFHQRIRWASKADQYDDRRIFWVLLLVYLVNLLFAGLFVAAFWNSWWLWILLLMLVVKIAVEYPFVRSVAGFFGQQRLMVYFAVLQPFHILYTIIVGWLGTFGSYRWKDRKISK
ncbi:MAG: glycosyltransferase [Bacteroidetes bacterium]|nr:glycosyltransferase [Bacteroidota bacterium]